MKRLEVQRRDILFVSIALPREGATRSRELSSKARVVSPQGLLLVIKNGNVRPPRRKRTGLGPSQARTQRLPVLAYG